MKIINETANSTLVIILGASHYPIAPRFSKSKAFLHAATNIKEYFLAGSGFQLPLPQDKRLLWLFNSDMKAANQVDAIELFLKDKCDSNINNIIIYYVGHGSNDSHSRGYYLAIKATDQNNSYDTSINMTHLASVLNQLCCNKRRYLILDSCYAAESSSNFLDGSLPADGDYERFQKGTSLLCASSASTSAFYSDHITYFAESFLEVLLSGIHNKNCMLSLSDVCEAVKNKIHEKHPDDGPRPECHSAYQSDGDIAIVPLFPNYAVVDHDIIISPAREIHNGEEWIMGVRIENTHNVVNVTYDFNGTKRKGDMNSGFISDYKFSKSTSIISIEAAVEYSNGSKGTIPKSFAINYK